VKSLNFISLSFIFPLVLSQCSTTPEIQIAPPVSEVSTYKSPKKILVFLDGTNNQWDSRTNVRRLFEMISSWEDPRVVCHYMDGVGSSSSLVIGNAFGKGMKNRILEGYEFLSTHYNPGDQIYIYGFSRGSLQARSLAGMISFCGLLEKEDAPCRKKQVDVWHFCKRQEEDAVDLDGWQKSVQFRQAPLAEQMRTQLGLESRWAEIGFVGVWDTVPGSTFTDFSTFREEKDDNNPGTRYKPGAYPPIQTIAHAMSLDELRSKFAPIQVAPPVMPSRTRLREVWFAGAHSDVGGGYSDSSALSGVSLNWMIQQMSAYDSFWSRLPSVFQDPLAPQHRSIEDAPGNFLSDEAQRALPENATIHPSVYERMAANGVRSRIKGRKFSEPAKYKPQAKSDQY
jgi:uncharacterized protein (DUF2235 family)